MSWYHTVKEFFQAHPAKEEKVTEAVGNQSEEEDDGYRRITDDGQGIGRRDLTPVAQDRMQRIAEWLWQSNMLANRLIEIPLAYLLAEGVKLECADEDHQKLLDRHWNDPINNWPLKLYGRARDLSIYGEQCYVVQVNGGNGFVRLGYLDARAIDRVVTDPDNAEQPIGVVTKKDAAGNVHKYKVIVLGEDRQLFTRRTADLRERSFTDGECFLFQVNKLATGSRGRSDLLAQMDWLDAYDEFLFNEFDRVRDLRVFVWDLTVSGGDPDAVAKHQREFKPPTSGHGVYAHNDNIELEAKTPDLQANDTSTIARAMRNHVLGGATVPEHWFGGGGDVNRAAASEMGEPTFKMFTARQTQLKLMLEEVGRYVLWRSVQTGEPDWSDPAWKVTAVFPELVNKDVTKFASALQQMCTAVVVLIDKGLITEERALKMVADIAGRFGQEIDAVDELAHARKERAQRQKDKEGKDVFDKNNLPQDLRDADTDPDAEPRTGTDG